MSLRQLLGRHFLMCLFYFCAPKLALGSLLGSLGRSFGPTPGPLFLSWYLLGDHFVILGCPLALSHLAWNDSGEYFKSFSH